MPLLSISKRNGAEIEMLIEWGRVAYVAFFVVAALWLCLTSGAE